MSVVGWFAGWPVFEISSTPRTAKQVCQPAGFVPHHPLRKYAKLRLVARVLLGAGNFSLRQVPITRANMKVIKIRDNF
jgi:hypothetical protein